MPNGNKKAIITIINSEVERMFVPNNVQTPNANSQAANKIVNMRDAGRKKCSPAAFK